MEKEKLEKFIAWIKDLQVTLYKFYSAVEEVKESVSKFNDQLSKLRDIIEEGDV